jgi:hypothetical protein
MSKRGMRGMSMRARVAVAAAVLAGGGAAGAVALSAGHNSGVAAESAGFIQSGGGQMSYSSAISSAMKTWNTSPSTSLQTLTHMQQINNYWTQSWHHVTLFFQRGKVVETGRNKFEVRSADGQLEIWQVSGKTAILNVGGTSMGMKAMTGGSVNMQVPSSWNMDTQTRGLAKGDFVFVFGERAGHTLKAQLVLFAARSMTNPQAPTPANGSDMNNGPQAPAVAPGGGGGTPSDFGTHF